MFSTRLSPARKASRTWGKCRLRTTISAPSPLLVRGAPRGKARSRVFQRRARGPTLGNNSSPNFHSRRSHAFLSQSAKTRDCFLGLKDESRADQSRCQVTDRTSLTQQRQGGACLPRLVS